MLLLLPREYSGISRKGVPRLRSGSKIWAKFISFWSVISKIVLWVRSSGFPFEFQVLEKY